MNPTFTKTAFRYLLTSATLTFLSALLALVMAAIVPFRIGPDLSQPTSPGRVYTEAEMKQAEDQARLGMEKTRQMVRDDPLHLVPDIKRSALAITWLPWFVAPFLFRVKSRFSLAALLVIPSVLVITPLMVLTELPLYAVALFLGDLIACSLRPG